MKILDQRGDSCDKIHPDMDFLYKTSAKCHLVKDRNADNAYVNKADNADFFVSVVTILHFTILHLNNIRANYMFINLSV